MIKIQQKLKKKIKKLTKTKEDYYQQWAQAQLQHSGGVQGPIKPYRGELA